MNIYLKKCQAFKELEDSENIGKSFLEVLNKKIAIAEENYKTAQELSMQNLKTCSIYNDAHYHVKYGAASYTHIDQVTKYATEMKTLYEIKKIYESCQKENL